MEIACIAVAPKLLRGRVMRLALLCVLLAGCSLYLEEHGKKKVPPPDAPEIQDAYYPECGPRPADAGTCDCVYGQWRCNTCPWPNPEPVIACSHVGASCDYEDWEHGCSCTCDASGWWKCTPETIGSTCPSPPPPDAAL